MKTLTLLTCLALFCNAQAQEKNKPTADQKAFQHAVSLVEDNRTDESLLAFYEFMNAFPQSPMVAKAHYNIGYLQFQRKNFTAAIIAFKQILSSDYNERDPNSLMEPYMLYRHNSARMLAEISLQQQNFTAAEEYISLFEHDYPYQHFCGNELSANAIYTATMKARAYEGQGKPMKAIQALVPFTFDNALASNEELLDLLTNILYRHYTTDQLRTELTNALNTCEVKTTKRDHRATLTLFGKKVDLYDYFYEDEGDKKTERNVEFYKKMAQENRLFKKIL